MSTLIYQSQLTYWNISYLFERIWCYIKKLEYLSVHCQSVFKIAYEIPLFASKIFDLVTSSDDKFCHTKNIEKNYLFLQRSSLSIYIILFASLSCIKCNHPICTIFCFIQECENKDRLRNISMHPMIIVAMITHQTHQPLFFIY